MVTNTDKQEFDAIVIGSGIGGLTVAALLAKQQNKKVLVLEQHFTAGGFTHGFERKGKFHWDVGLHYVGEMEKGSMARLILDYISNSQLQWQKMPNLFDKFVYPDFSFSADSDPKKFQADLMEKFPHEQAGIQRYFTDVQSAALWFITNSLLEIFPAYLHFRLKQLLRHFDGISRQTTQHYLDQNFQDPQLKALLVSQWGNYGLPPAESCFGIHSVVVTHFFGGGWYPIGGATAIAQTIIPVIEQAGGKVLTQRRVTEILVESGMAKGVKVQDVAHPQADLQIYDAPVVISDAGAFNTYLKLIPDSFPMPEREAIKAFPKGSTVFTVYLGLKESPQKLGFQGENHWIYDTYDHNSIAEHPLQFCYLSFPSLKNPSAQGHTAEIIASADYNFFLPWQDQPWRRRGTDYTEQKTQIMASLIQFIENHYPGFQDLIEYAELSTPITFEHFATSDRGAIYGIPCVPERLDQSWISSKTPIKNLYLTGTDAFSPGIMGSMMGGVKTAGFLQGSFGFLKIMATIWRQ